jgi:hypothetical protein
MKMGQSKLMDFSLKKLHHDKHEEFKQNLVKRVSFEFTDGTITPAKHTYLITHNTTTDFPADLDLSHITFSTAKYHDYFELTGMKFYGWNKRDPFVIQDEREWMKRYRHG